MLTALVKRGGAKELAMCMPSKCRSLLLAIVRTEIFQVTVTRSGDEPL